MAKTDDWEPMLPGEDMYQYRDRLLNEGRERWKVLTKDWSEEDREWAANFWMNAGMPWA